MSAKPSRTALKSMPPRPERRKTSAISSFIWRKTTSPKDSVLFVTVADLHQVRAPVEGVVRAPEHQPRDGPHLRHDTRCDQVVDPPVVPVLRRALPDAEVREGPAPEVLAGEDRGGRCLRAPVMLEDGLQLFVVEGFPGGSGAVGGLHGRRRLQVDVDAVILCPERRGDAQEHKDYHGDDKPSHLFGT